MIPRRATASHGLTSRLLTGQAIVLLAGALTTGLLATLLGPPIFHGHLIAAGQAENSPELRHIELAYRDASVLALGVGLIISIVAAGAVTWFLTGRLRRPLTALTDAATELSRGHYDTQVPTGGSGTELDTLAATFNDLAQRLADVEGTRRRLLSDLAHELRTPIATLTAYHEAMFDGVTDAQQAHAVLSEQTARLTRLADDITEVSRAEEGVIDLELRHHDVVDVLTSSADGLRDRFSAKSVRLVVDEAGAAGLVVCADRERLGQVLANLLTNALRHTPPGGQVTLSAAEHGAEVAITVTDTGEGISAEQLPHIFERFYRGDEARDRDRSGSGIGLTISRAIVDAHGGALSAHSDGPGLGSRFTVYLGRETPAES
ncbi:sensor histidine kinase [Kribbia dieselivorans]|uniref:sensor histidine kinase n=1 Tax=Kribbia dieselivorans TaxID=331526 RepID=UPI000838F824|nr:ATP-binding protein [Kribbia dieselivorans]